ncbi:unnamed protein product [Tilletia laevis]|uniref:F-box domain-containing protein n=1 Tax=Tilletia laevis TaxID=157183 RepID=A0A9N8M5U9_9BASI|nr:unnamed protein product [Tilletia laevis]
MLTTTISNAYLVIPTLNALQRLQLSLRTAEAQESQVVRDVRIKSWSNSTRFRWPKGPKHPTATHPDPSAVARFFATPELVLIVLDHLLADRIDLLVVASVCKRLRTPALQAWVRNLDFHHDSFEEKLELLQANTHLLAHIRYLRIFNCVEWFDFKNPNRKRPPSFWDQIKALLSLLAAHMPSHAEGPLLDIVIDVDDGDALYQALRPHPKLGRRIAALRLFDLCRFSAARISKSVDRYSTSGWTSLALLLKDALPRTSSAENLRVVEYKCYSVSQEVEFRRAAKRIFWSTLTDQCKSLHELGLLISFGDDAHQLLLQGNFPSLKTFELREIMEDETLLNVEAISAPFQLCKNWSSVEASRVETKEFSSSPDTFKHLPSAENASVAELNGLIKDGARPLRASALLKKLTADRTSGIRDDNRFSDLGMEAWEGVRPEFLEDLTFLEVTPVADLVDLHDLQFGQLFASDLFPNLAELHIRLVDEECGISTLDVLFCHLASSTSLRVLVRFELLCWSDDNLRFDYFRFVADSAETQDSASTSATQIGKMGRLQAIAERIILTEVGSDGVWRQRSNIGGGNPTATVLNHDGV